MPAPIPVVWQLPKGWETLGHLTGPRCGAVRLTCVDGVGVPIANPYNAMGSAWCFTDQMGCHATMENCKCLKLHLTLFANQNDRGLPCDWAPAACRGSRCSLMKSPSYPPASPACPAPTDGSVWWWAIQMAASAIRWPSHLCRGLGWKLGNSPPNCPFLPRARDPGNSSPSHLQPFARLQMWIFAS